MTDLLAYAAALDGMDLREPAPVDKWRPDRIGEIDITIKADGVWVHEGAPIRRARLVQLLSSVLRREEGGYYLVTPVEKLKIHVEDAPFVAVTMVRSGKGAGQKIVFSTNLGDTVVAGHAHEMRYRQSSGGDFAPFVDVRRGLEARIARPVFYDLVAAGERRHMEGAEMFGVWSDGVFFPFGPADDLDG